MIYIKFREKRQAHPEKKRSDELFHLTKFGIS
jgi:hypothetical protein